MAIGDFPPNGNGSYRPDRVAAATATLAPGNDRRTETTPEPVVATGRALVPTAPTVRPSAPAGMTRGGAEPAFLAQLIANTIGLPQTRARRRVTPTDGNAAYRAAEDLGRAAPRPGRRLRRSA